MNSEAAGGGTTLNKAPIETSSEAAPDELPLPSDPKTVFLGGLFILAMLGAAYVARDIVLPLIFAFVFNLLLQPALRLLDRLHLPRTASALSLIVVLLAIIVGLGTAVSGPAETWAAKLPEGIPRLEERLSFVQAPINSLQQFLRQVEDFGRPKPSVNAAPQAPSPTLFMTVFAGTRNFASGFFTTVLFLFFLLVAGDVFLHRLVEILPRFGSKRQVVEISNQIESDISAYLITITIMNAAVGTAMALVTWLTGVGDPIFWGTIAFLLNYVPILGTAVGAVIFLLVGLLTIEPLWQALLPVVLYLGIHVIEGETVTPMLLAKRFTINPVLVIISLVFWFWMWGVPGVILAVPMLAITKIICDRVGPLAAIGHFLEG
jgi:predicted PurR-regulated permease PerM